jgi:hypothetical protein
MAIGLRGYDKSRFPMAIAIPIPDDKRKESMESMDSH